MKTIAEINADIREYLSAAGADVVITHDFTGWENAEKAILITETRLEYERQQDLDLTVHRTVTATAQLIGKDLDTVNEMIDNISNADIYAGPVIRYPLIETVVIDSEEGDIHTARLTLWAEIWDYDDE